MKLIMNFFTPGHQNTDIKLTDIRIDYIWRGLPEVIYLDWSGDKRWEFDKNGKVGFSINLDNVKAFHEIKKSDNLSLGSRDLDRISEWNRFKNIIKKITDAKVIVDRTTPYDVSPWRVTLYFAEGMDGVSSPENVGIKVIKENSVTHD